MTSLRRLTGAVAAATAAALALPWSAAQAQRGWAPPVVVPAAGELGGVDAARPAAGETLLVWTDAGPGELATIRAAVVRAGSRPEEPAALGRRAFWPTVEALRDGSAVAAWEHEPVEGEFQRRQRILVAMRLRGGGFGPPADVGQGQGGIALASNRRGDVAVLFVRYGGRDPVSREVVQTRRLYAAFRPAGGAFGPEQPVTDVIPQNLVTGAHDVALGPTGAALFVWEEPVPGGRNRVRAAVRTASGAVQAPQTLSDPSRDASAPSVAVDGHGNALAVWLESASGDGPVAVRPGEVRVAFAAGFADRPAPFGSSRGLGEFAAGTQPPQVATSDAGDGLIAYGQVIPLGADAHQLGPARVVRADLRTGRVGAPAAVGGSSMTRAVGLAVASPGDALVAFDDFDTGEMRVARGTAASGLGPATTVACPPPGAPLAGTLALGPDGDGVVTWLASDRRAIAVSSEAAGAPPGPAYCGAVSRSPGAGTLEVRARAVRLAPRRRLATRVSCATSCAVSLRAALRVPGRRQIRAATARPVNVAGRGLVGVRLRSRDATALRRALRRGRRIVVRVRVGAVDAAGRRAADRRRLTLRR